MTTTARPRLTWRCYDCAFTEDGLARQDLDTAMVAHYAQAHPELANGRRILASVADSDLLPAFRFPADVEGYPSEAECRYLFAFACAVPVGGRIVELGSYKGRSAVSLAQSHRRVYCHDRFLPESGPYRLLAAHAAGEFNPEHIYAAAGRYGVGDYIEVRAGETLHGARDWRHAGGLPIDLLFIDACHEYECVRADFEAWSQYVTVDGIVIFDDVLWPGVQQLLMELRYWAPVEGPQAGGMAAFRRIR